MTNKRNLVAGIFLSLLIITLMTFSLTYARYSDELESDGILSGETEYIVSNQIEVDSVNSFIAAIENGYTNIKISEEVDNPLIITGGVSDVNSDLTIDLNGHELQRNNREPVLNVTQGVRLTITDSKGGGCFYNPVGSALRVSGGTLTVTSGIFESGPRDGYQDQGQSVSEDGRFPGEYALHNGTTWETGAGAELSSTAYSVSYYEKTGTGTENLSYSLSSEKTSMPLIVPYIEKRVSMTDEGETTHFYVNGNMYFENAVSSYFPADTYLYYTLAGDNVENTNMAADDRSADFYYTYYVVQDESTGKLTYADSSAQNARLVTVYGYNSVKGTATEQTNFAAIQMESGNLYVRGGRYTAYFGKSSTNCVYAAGGLMTVENAGLEARGQSVCVSINYRSDVDTSEEYLRVDSGTFYSETGDTIHVTGGMMNVQSGTFTKNVSSDNSTAGAGKSAIYVSGGVLTVNGTNDNRVLFNLNGSGIYGINVVDSSAADTSATVTCADFNFAGASGANGSYNCGIRAAGGTVHTDDVKFTYAGSGSNNFGIYSEGGKIVSDTTHFVFNDGIGTGDENKGIYVEGEASSATVTNGEFLFDGGGSYNYGIQVSGGSVSATYVDFRYSDGSKNSYGIYSNSGTVVASDASFTYSGNGSNNFGVYTSGGKITISDGAFDFNAGGNESVNYSGSYNCGIYSAGGSVIVNGGEFNFHDASASSTGHYGIHSASNSGTAGSVECNDAVFTIRGAYSAGILAEGGTVTLGGSKFTCTVEDPLHSIGNYKYLSSTAISTEGGNVTLAENCKAVISTNGLGITSRESEGRSPVILINGDMDLSSTRGTAIYLNGGTLAVNATVGDDGTISAENYGTIVNVTSTIGTPSGQTSDTAYGWVMPPEAGSGETPNNVVDVNNGVFVEGGSLYSYGTLNVTHTGVDNDTSGYNYANQPIKSYAVRVTASGNRSPVVEIYAGQITNNVGGGIYVGGGKVTLGKEAEANGPSVTTTGTGVTNQTYQVSGQYGGWNYYLSVTGGHAVEVNGGSITIYGGNYTAAHGNGIFIRNTTTSDKSAQNQVLVKNGYFIGYNQKSGLVGPAASYGLNVNGNVNVVVDGGIFGSKAGNSNSAAAFIGPARSEEGKATAQINGGKFYGYAGDVVSIFENVNVRFGSENLTDNSQIVMESDTSNVSQGALISVQETLGYPSPMIEFYSGTYDCEKANFAIYYGNSNAKVNIYGGVFSSRESVIHLNASPVPNWTVSNILLIGGTFMLSTSWTTNGAIIGGNHARNVSYNGSYDGNDYLPRIIADGSTAYGSDSIDVEGTQLLSGSCANIKKPRIDVTKN